MEFLIAIARGSGGCGGGGVCGDMGVGVGGWVVEGG